MTRRIAAALARTSVSCAGVLSLLTVLASAQQLALSPFRPVSGDSAVGVATGDQAKPAIARGANGWLVAWSDRRASLASLRESPESARDIFAVRLDAFGQRVESTSFALSRAPGDDTDPLVQWNGSNWLVVWKAQTSVNAPYSSALVGARVDAAGQVLDSTPITILAYPWSEIGTTLLASDGVNWVVAAQGTSAGYANLRAARISGAGAVLDANPVELMPEGQLLTRELAYAQGSFLLVWSNYNGMSDDIVGRRFDSSLAWQDAAPFAISNSIYDDIGAQVGSNGSQFLVVWSHPFAGIWNAVEAARVTPGGVVLDAAPLALSPTFAYGSGPSSPPAWDGQYWYAPWNDFGERIARVTAAGAVVDAGGFALDTSANSTLDAPQLSGDPAGGVQLVWQDDRAGSYEGLDVYAARVTSPAGAGLQVGISTGASAQVRADLVHGAANSLLVFRSESSGQRRILASRLDAFGVALDAEPLEVATGPLVNEPSAAWDGSTYLVAWESGTNSNLVARRLAPNGVWLDATPIAIGVGTTPEVCGKNGEFLVAYTRTIGQPVQQFPVVARIDGATGALLGAALTLSSNYAIDPDVCVVGDRWLVAWRRNYWNNDTHCDIHAAFVDSAGVPTTPFWVAGGFNEYNHSVSLASSGDEALISWVHGASSNLTRRVRARRIADDGSFLDAGPLTVAPSATGEQFAPASCWNGAEYIVVFQDLRAATSLVDKRSDLYAVRVTQQGLVLDPNGAAVEVSSESEASPALAGLGGGRALLASSRFDAAAPLAAYRIGLRSLDSGCPTPTTYCTAKTTSIGSLPSIGFVGVPSLGGAGFQLLLQQGPPNVNAIHFYGGGPDATPFAGGWRCATLPLVRAPVLALDATGAAAVSLNMTPALIGVTRFYQWWMRDPQNPDGTKIALSDALAVTFCP